MVIKISWFLFFAAFLMSIPAFAVNAEAHGFGYDMLAVLSSFVSFVLNQLLNLLSFIEDAISGAQDGSSDIPIFGSIQRALEYAGMKDYAPPETLSHGNFIVDRLCNIALFIVGTVKKLLEYMQMSIEDGFFTGALKNIFKYLHSELEHYEFYHVFLDFLKNFHL